MSLHSTQLGNRKGRAGYSLAELLLTLAIVAIGLSLAWTQLGTTKNTQQVQAAAQVLADRIRQLRQEAMTKGVPQGIAFPSLNGTTAQSQSCYFLEGEQKPVITSVLNWVSEYPKALCNVGTWTLDAPAIWAAPVALAGTKTFDLSTWVSPHPEDALFVFTPSGSVVANQPSFNGSYHIVLSEASAFAPARVVSMPTYNLQSVPSPWTITVSASGQVSVAPGLASGSTVSGAFGAAAPAPALVLPPLNNHAPQILSVGTNPTTIPGSVPAGIDAGLSPSGYLTFTIHATDPDGDALSCKWTASSGSFSAAENSIMEWDPIGNYWYSNWTFVPPTGAAPDATIDLTCTVTDSHGESVTGGLGFNGKIQVTARPKLVFLSNCSDPGVSSGWMTSNLDGGERHLMMANVCKMGQYCLNARWSPDGNWMAYIFFPDWTTGYAGNRSNGILYLASKDGTGRTKLLTCADLGTTSIEACCFSQDGTKIICSGQTPDGKILVAWTTLSGTKPSSPDVPGADTIVTGILGAQHSNNMDLHNPTGYIMLATQSGTMHFIKPDGTQIPVNMPNVVPECQICFSHAGDKLYTDSPHLPVQRWDFSYTPGAASATLSNLTPITSLPYDQVGCESPDGKSFIFTRTDPVKQLYQNYKVDLATKAEYDLSGNSFTEDEVNVQSR